ncbi:hypothetical protein [Clostridium botulinum]|uniref:hypothetical protein n=1 Tax=Clostridium botulinum TaxID=1491 RepID=UPI00388E6B59
MNNITINVNGIEMNVSSNKDRIIIKPITNNPSLVDYSFGMHRDSTIEYFIDKLDNISKNISKLSKVR